jgi:signal transduction histidine kinase
VEERLRSDRLFELTIQASERERHRLALELHAGILQELGALRVLLDAMGRQGELPSEAHEAAVRHLDRGITNLQTVITELRPSVLDELGVGPALETLALRVGDSHGVEITVDVDLPLEDRADRLAPELEASIYRLVQEAIANAIAHGGAQRIVVTLTRSDAAVEVIVRDDGSGFDHEAADRGFGLIGMQERVALAGGRLEIESAPGVGTTILADLPA